MTVIDAEIQNASATEELAWIEAVIAAPISRPLVRIWNYDAPAVVLGVSRKPDEAMQSRAAKHGIALRRRITGGGAVLAGPWMLGVSVALPAAHSLVLPGIAESFRWFGLAHADALNDLGIATEPAHPVGQLRDQPLNWACFANLSHWELHRDGRKLVGLAQARRRNGVLLSSGVLVDDSPWELLAEVMGESAEDAAQLATRTISCAQLQGQSVSRINLARTLVGYLVRSIRSG